MCGQDEIHWISQYICWRNIGPSVEIQLIVKLDQISFQNESFRIICRYYTW